MRAASHRHARGVSMLEVLIALFVLSIGLLGVAALQTIGYKLNHQSYERTQATFQAYDIIDRMRANRSSGGGAINSAYDDVSLGSKPGSTDCIATTCAPGVLAEYDIRTWNTANERLLSAGQGAICRGTFDADLNCTVSGAMYRVGLRWKEGEEDMQLVVEAQLL